MPDLPIISLAQEHFDRVVAAFPGATAAQKSEAYRVWTIGHLIDFVKATERARLEAELRTALDQRVAELEASLPPRPQFPPTT